MADRNGHSRLLEEVMGNLSLATNYHTDSASDTDNCTPENGKVDVTTPPDSGVDTSRFPHAILDTNNRNETSPVNDIKSNNYRHLRSPAAMYTRGPFQSSRTWVSPDTKQMQEFAIIRNAMRRLFKNADVAKWKLPDYIAHRKDVLAAEKARVERQVKAKEDDKERELMRSHEQNSYAHLLGYTVTSTLNTVGNRSLVLGEPTIWCVHWQHGKEEIAPWPTLAEMKWEGDDRAKTSVGRYLPLPREMGAPGITWSQLQVIEQYELDQVSRIPTMEDIYLPVDEIDDDVKYDLITKDLEESMDAFLEI